MELVENVANEVPADESADAPDAEDDGGKNWSNQ